jgi:hypothetical protein
MSSYWRPAKRASARLDEYGPKLEQFSNQPKR